LNSNDDIVSVDGVDADGDAQAMSLAGKLLLELHREFQP
jgi:hypothetical protein